MPSHLIISVRDHIGFITLNNPNKSNAINPDLRDELIAAYQSFDKNPNVRIIILNGNGKHFCAGADLTHMEKMKTVSNTENLTDAKQFAQLFHTIYSCEKPTICCAHGKIIGGGLGLLAACDIAIATHDARFCFSEVKVGLVPATIAPYVTQRIGYQFAKYSMMTAELFDAQKAWKIGLIDHTTHLTPIDFAVTLAESMLHNNQNAMQETKKWLHTLRPITVTQIEQSAAKLAMMRQPNNARNN